MPDIVLTTRNRDELPREKHSEFYACVLDGWPDVDLATYFGLRERTAINYRLRAEQLAADRGDDLAPRKRKGAAASDDHAHI